jgi:hypothetical protein
MILLFRLSVLVNVKSEMLNNKRVLIFCLVLKFCMIFLFSLHFDLLFIGLLWKL